MTIDKKDHAIMKELLRDSRQTTAALSKRLNMPITTIHNRIMKLRKNKVILNYTINPDYIKLGTPIFAYIGVSVDYLAAGPHKKIKQSDVAKELKKIEGIQEVTIMTGGTDILVKALAADIFALNLIVTEKMRNVTGVDKTQTSIVLQEV
jgi:Lrp/AsnC family transcriptional regulator, leucine-responsive regulatory protein